MNLLKRIQMISVICLMIIGIDQGTKWYASEYLPKFEMTSYWSDILRIGYAENTGAFLGLGSGMSDSAKFWIFVCAVGLILSSSADLHLKNKDTNRIWIIVVNAYLFRGYQ
ncbi:signal peptidase II [uncultured Paraglaciecola sp.]|uniref:signal peptidase II n=1 Tax=uncultured Paraglaciecola sp. TaxID=1765024 RepID=UPI002616C156|nr:signal peptidase II [uncultured Paraglaciecola sp.]